MKIIEKTELFYDALYEVMAKKIGEENGDFAEDFTAMLLSLKGLFDALVEDETKDLIDFIHILNKLAVQYLISGEN
jgi:hypothetical protein